MADIEQAKRLFPLTKKDDVSKQEFHEVARKIKRAIDRKAPYSGEMMFLLRGQRHTKHPWIQKLLET